MSKPVKDLIAQEYARTYDGVDSACVVSLVGIGAVSTHALRNELRAKDIRVQVVKNSLARRAFADGPLAPLGNVLDGPCALVIGGASIVDVAKELVRCRKTYPALALKTGIIEGDPKVLAVEKIAALKNRTELLGEVAMLAASPGRCIAGCVRSGGGRIAGCVKALIERLEAGGRAA